MYVRSAFCCEERGQQLGGRRGPDGWLNSGFVIQTGIGADVVQRSGGTSLRVAGPEHEVRNPGVQNGAGTHWTGLQRDDEGRMFQPPTADNGSRIAKRQYLGVRRRVTGEFPLVVSAGDDLTVHHDDGTNRDVAVLGRSSRFNQSQIHRLFVRHAEEVGFEPTVSCPTHAFQACRFGRSRTPPVTSSYQDVPRGSEDSW
jgi:hypothetical protein